MTKSRVKSHIKTLEIAAYLVKALEIAGRVEEDLDGLDFDTVRARTRMVRGLIRDAVRLLDLADSEVSDSPTEHKSGVG